jgi:hypothetical protein
MPSPETIRLLAEIRGTLAGSSLTERQARLYSQRLRREMGRPGLATFTPADVRTHLDEAMMLLECALIERNAAPNGPWRDGVKRAAEILEFLSQSDLRPPGTPMHLLAAGAYQVAGFPAMALAQLSRMPAGEDLSSLLHEFLRADFPATLNAVRSFWRQQNDLAPEQVADLSVQAIRHTVMCIGTVCSYFKTGNDASVVRAVTKLHAIAAGFLHSRDQFSYLLARLTALTCERYVSASLWNNIRDLSAAADAGTRDALQQFGRSAFVNRRALVWPAQASGINRLTQNTSFVLCTPTGSGKTTVATLAIVQGLFTRPERPLGLETLEPDNLILYLVPSRALAAEVEGKLAQDLRGIAARPVVVTGLYGGIDWGPTDAWVQTDGPTIVICTFEKGDALIRNLGILFLHRVRLVAIDEAHMVEQDTTRPEGLADGSSRSFRLELLGTRLLDARDRYRFRLIALSAVAAGAAPALARWIGGDRNALPTTSDYRSTRQMLGRIEVTARGQFNIRYELMDGRSLRFEDERRAQTPFVPTPFPPMPGGIEPNLGPEKAMQAPTLWAALHLAAEQPDGTRPSVLISLTQNPEPFAAECANRLETWTDDQLPNYREPQEGNLLWERSLASAADYFGTNSVEYRLLQRGVAVHHGKMPGLLARRLKLLIDRGYVRVIIATSTLSEGVNIPVTYLLIPSVYRSNEVLTLQEFTNLIGRAGRPGVSTEGHVLVVLPEPRGRQRSRQWQGYNQLVTSLRDSVARGEAGARADSASSALAHLLSAIGRAWRSVAGPRATPQQFAEWLEQTSVTDQQGEVSQAVQCLDSLDSFLLAAVQELEELQGQELPPDALEENLTRIWQRSYAFAAARDEERLRRVWLRRGRVIKQRYPDAAARRQIYKTSLSPRSAVTLVARANAIRARLLDGANYAALNTDERLTFVADVLRLIADVPSFRISRRLGRRDDFEDWQTILRWWLAKSSLQRQPPARDITKWYDFAAQNFIYRGAWGLGSILGLLLDQGDGNQPIRALEIDDWPRSGLPWIAFWLKELITWGTLEPVAAFLLARGDAVDRPQAERDAAAYYEQLPYDMNANDMLDPRRIRDWLNLRGDRGQRIAGPAALTVAVDLAREANAYVNPHLNVMHFEVEGVLNWIDPAGYVVAQSARPREWPAALDAYDFELDVANAVVRGAPYQPHA